MLRRLIPVLSLSVFALMVVTISAENAYGDAASRQARRASRRGVRTGTMYPTTNQQNVVPQGTMVPGTMNNPQVTGYRSYYRTPQTSDIPAGAVLLSVQVPANAKVFINGEQTQTTGNFRQYVTPSLDQGRQYTTEVKARWTNEAGQEVVRTRRIPVQYGQNVDINLIQPTPEEARQMQTRRNVDDQ